MGVRARECKNREDGVWGQGHGEGVVPRAPIAAPFGFCWWIRMWMDGKLCAPARSHI